MIISQEFNVNQNGGTIFSYAFNGYAPDDNPIPTWFSPEDDSTKYQNMTITDKMWALYSVLAQMDPKRISVYEGRVSYAKEGKQTSKKETIKIFEKEYSIVVKALHNLYKTHSIKLITENDNNKSHKDVLDSMLDLWQKKDEDRFAFSQNVVSDLFEKVKDDINKSEAMYNVIVSLCKLKKKKK